jgi:hypothetical protein
MTKYVIYNAALQLTQVEAAILELKAQLCDGSMLKGHTAKKFEAVDMEKTFQAYAKLQAVMQELDEKMEQTNSAQILKDEEAAQARARENNNG